MKTKYIQALFLIESCGFLGGSLFLLFKFNSIVLYYQALDPKCTNVKLFFESGMAYGGGLAVISFLGLFCLSRIKRSPPQ